uniref:Uncharacterized protein n=1 Tax=Myripristis murdjan TaxID=586833 RepID=A0A668AX75_9TELE
CAPMVSESDLYRSVQAVLKEMDSQQPSACRSKGMLRWTLHKKVHNNPANSLALVRVVIKELEKVRLSGIYTSHPLLERVCGTFPHVFSGKALTVSDLCVFSVLVC